MTQELSDEGLREMARKLHIKVSHTVSHRNCQSCSDALFIALKQVRRETREADAKVVQSYADEMRASIDSRKPKGLPTIVAECKEDAAISIITAIRALEGSGS